MKRWMLNVLIVIFAAIFLVSGYFLVDYLLESKKTADLYNDLASMVDKATQPTEGQEQDSEDPSNPGITIDSLVEVTNSDTGETEMVLREYADIYELNSHTVGWLRIDGTPVNYPVVHMPEIENYYLYRDFNRENNNHGCLYIEEACDVYQPTDNITIYGHWMRDDSMFGSLQSYKDEAYYKQHQIIQFDTMKEHHTYEVICVFRTTATAGKGFTYNQFVNAANEEEFNKFIETCHSLEMFDTGKTAVYGDKLICLSTCEYSQTNGRLVIVAKRIA